MSLRSVTLACAALLAGASHATAEIRITRDLGGDERIYGARVDAAQASHERIVIDGICASGCTFYLALPRGQVCATGRGVFVFHSARDALLGLPSWRGNERVMQAYPDNVRIAIGQRGGLWLEPIRIRATALVPRCSR